MRFHRLDLIKYGKFSDRSVEFPAAKQDFHLIVGPNEAGKSTLRSAIVDLLFGIPPRSILGFLHPLNELRLGAYISNTLGALEFQRAKAQKQTLRSPLDEILPDTALTPFLGAGDRDFFDQMFGLDHARLVSGSNSILSAQNDVGQILFQSAAGVSSLGKIRDALAAEANKLWAPRKSADREYYIAADQLDKATTALKEATVRTKVWVEANSKVEELQELLSSDSDRHQQLQSQRSCFERVRRLAPFLTTIRETEKKLTELGEYIELPIDAATTLSAAERELAVARQRLELRNDEVEKATEALKNIDVDEVLLGRAADISKLDKLRIQYSAHESDIEHRKLEIAVLWQDICGLCTQLGWTAESETAIAQRVPTSLVQRELRELIRSHSGILQAHRSAEQAEINKQSEIESLSKQLDELQLGEVKPALRAALATARSFGDSDAIVQKQQNTLIKAKSAVENLLPELGPWSKSFPDLIAMQTPSQTKIGHLLQERQSLIADRKAESIRLKNQKIEVARIELEISQFKALHHPTTLEVVFQARQERDAKWNAIKTGKSDLQEESQLFETTIVHADKAADSRTIDVEKETELKSLLHQLEREKQSLATVEAQCLDLDNKIQLFDDNWAEQAAGFNLPDMPLDEIGAWIIKREKVLAARAVEQDIQNDFDSLCRLISEARHNLINALQDVGQKISEPDRLTVLCVQAEDYIQGIEGANVRHETLSAQLREANKLAAVLKKSTADALTDKTRWNEAWATTLKKAGLATDSDIGTVEGTLELIGQISEKLSKMRQIQVERIDTMNADLKEFSAEANRLAEIICPAFKAESSNQIAIELAQRLTQTRELDAERARLRESLRVANIQAQAANDSIKTAIASLKPLMARACVDTNAQLDKAISRSDEQRRLNTDLSEANRHLMSGGDGFSRIQIEAEIDAVVLVQLPSELAKINDGLTVTLQQQKSLSAELANASRILSEIGGSDAAALAEAQRQEAISKMSDVAERYVKVLTAERLLRWSIDRYREEKQGPLLQRAGAIFTTLTSGSFRKLVVDFEREPMVLEGLRSDGKLVGIPGMSDGTRDQLYLALRLAALEMHLDQAMPLPFIADDLFINYDDVRSKAGFEALRALSEQTQVIFLSHHDHLIPTVQEVFGKQVNVVML
jgi:uncharacterized protein YhaN